MQRRRPANGATSSAWTSKRPGCSPTEFWATGICDCAAFTCTWARRSCRPSLTRRPSKRPRVVADFRRRGHEIDWINLGGGFGISYRKQEGPPASDYARVIVPAVREAGCRLGAGAGPVHRRQRRRARQPGHLHQAGGGQEVHHSGRGDERPGPPDDVRLVPPHLAGPAARCAAGRLRGRRSRLRTSPTLSDRSASRAISWPRTAVCPSVDRGDYLVTFSAGAYGMAMSSNYNGRPAARSDGRRQDGPPHPPPRDVCRSRRARAALIGGRLDVVPTIVTIATSGRLASNPQQACSRGGRRSTGPSSGPISSIRGAVEKRNGCGARETVDEATRTRRHGPRSPADSLLRSKTSV